LVEDGASFFEQEDLENGNEDQNEKEVEKQQQHDDEKLEENEEELPPPPNSNSSTPNRVRSRSKVFFLIEREKETFFIS